MLLDNIKCVIYDMDGLMFDTEKLAENIWIKIFKENNLEPNKEFLDAIKGRNIPDSNELFIKYYGNDLSFYTLKDRRNYLLEKELRTNGVPIKKGLVESLNYFKEHNKLIALASSSNKSLILDNLKDTNLESYFNYIVSGEEFKQSKPNPKIFLNVAKHFNIKPQDCLVLEDSKNGIEAAMNANMKAIWIPDLIYFEIDESKVIKLNSLLDILSL